MFVFYFLHPIESSRTEGQASRQRWALSDTLLHRTVTATLPLAAAVRLDAKTAAAREKQLKHDELQEAERETHREQLEERTHTRVQNAHAHTLIRLCNAAPPVVPQDQRPDLKLLPLQLAAILELH